MADEGFKRKLTAILSADVEGYSRLMDDDEAATVRTLTSYRSSITDIVQQFSGSVVDSPGDNILAEFTSVVDAVNCAVEIQRELAERNADLPDERKMQFRIGVNLGDVIDEEERIYGDGVNIAARIESLSEAGGICISHSAYDQIKNKLKFGYEYLGDHQVKNINDPVRVYKVLMGPEDAGKLIGKDARHSTKRWFVPVAVVAAIVTTSIAWYLIQNITRSDIEPASTENMAYALPDKPSIAVLPFNDFSKGSGQEYIADGITENIITTLSKTDKLFVIARNSTFKYKNQSVSIKEVSESLGVKYVLEGSVQIVNNRIRITAQLIDAIKGSHIWAQKYDKNAGDLFQIQDEIALKILEALRVKLTEGERALLIGGDTKNLEAYLMFLKGLGHSAKFNEKDNILARKAGQAAIEIDPEYPSAYRLLALTYLMDIWLGTSEDPKATIKKAFNLLEKVRSLDANSPGYYYLMGQLLLLTRQHDKAIKAAERAVSLSPNNSVFIFGLATIFRYNGEPDKALNLNKKVMRLNPYPESAYYVGLGYSYLSNDKYEESIEAFKKAISMSPDQYLSHRGLAVAYSQLGFEKEAKAAMSQTLKLRPQFSIEWIKRLPYRHKKDLNDEIARMEKAGFPKHPPLPLPDKPSIAVLAFDNLSGDPEQEYFSDGISENIIAALAQVGELFVIARNSSFTYKGKPVKVQQISRELGVRYVLEGSVQKSGDRVRITAQLIDARNGQHIWAENYDRELRDIFEIQDEITRKIVIALQVKLTEGEQARVGVKMKNPAAWFKVMQAVSYWRKGTKESYIKVGQLAQEIIDIEPDSVSGYRLLAWHHFGLTTLGISPRENLKKAFELSQKVLAMDENDALSHCLTGYVYLQMRKHEKAIESGKRAVELAPNGALVHLLLGSTLSYAGHVDEAIVHIKQAGRLDPYPAYIHYFHLGRCYIQKGQYEDALAEYKKGLQLSPDSFAMNLVMAANYALLDREDEARASAERFLEVNPNFSVTYYLKTSRFKNKDHTKLFADAFLKAGIPE